MAGVGNTAANAAQGNNAASDSGFAPVPSKVGSFRAGTNGVGYPSCIFCPEPSFSEEARTAKAQGVVVVQVTVQPDGHATNVEIVRGVGFGLDERALGAVRIWRFKPALDANGIPVAAITRIEVSFQFI